MGGGFRVTDRYSKHHSYRMAFYPAVITRSVCPPLLYVRFCLSMFDKGPPNKKVSSAIIPISEGDVTTRMLRMALQIQLLSGRFWKF